MWDLRYPRSAFLDAAGNCVSPDDPSLLLEGICTTNGSTRFSQVTGRIGLDFKVNDQWMLYGSIAAGEKPGGLNLISTTVLDPTPVDAIIVNDFGPEKITAYELGVKGTAFNGRMALDAAIFYNDWREIVLRQLQDVHPDSGLPLEQPTGLNVNAGDATVLGAELTANIAFTDNLSGRFTWGWVHSELDNAKQDQLSLWPSFRAPGCETVPPDDDEADACNAASGDVSGNMLMRQPEWMGSASLSYGRQLRGNWDWYIRGDATYQGGVYVGTDNQSWLPEHTYVNARLGIRSERYTVELWGRNLFEDDNAIAAFRDIYWTNTDNIYAPYTDQGPRPDFNKFPPFRYTVSYPRLRTYGINFEVRFGAAVR